MTAIKWLMNELFNNNGLKKEQGVMYVSPDLVSEAMQIEKQQIIDAYASGVLNECSGANIRSEQYYNEKYGVQGEAKE